MNRIRQLISDAAAAFGRLSPRERNLIVSGAAVALVFILALTGLSFSRAVSKRESRIQAKMEQMEEVRRLTGGYRQAEQQRTDLERRLQNNNVRLFTYLEELSNKEGIDIGGMTDKGSQPLNETKITESSVEVTFTRIKLEKLIKFLSGVESGSGLVKVTRMQIRPRSDEPVLDASLVITTYQLSS